MGIFGKKNETTQLDNTDRLEKLEFTLSQLQSIINHLANPIFAIELDGAIYYFSRGAGRILGKNFQEVLNRKFYTILPIEPKDHMREMYSEFIDKKVKTERDFTGPNKKPLKMILSPIFHEQSNIVTGAVIEMVDLTELKAFQQRQVDFVSFISHELRTPITSAKGYLDVVLHEADYLQEDHKRFIERALLSTQRQADTVEKLIDLSNLEQGQLITNFEEVNIVDVIQEVIGYWKDVASNKSLTLTFIYPKFQVSHVKADVTLIRNILNNLVDNAIKYTNQGSIEVSVNQHDSRILVSVKDTGIGIAKKVQKTLFEKFVRGEHSMTETTQGNGLGLYLSKRFVEQMGGLLTLESEVNKGSVFTFSLEAAKKLT